MNERNYILVDKVYYKELNSYKLFLYDNTRSMIIEVMIPISKQINLTELGDIENALSTE